jgi:hypothetical protein
MRPAFVAGMMLAEAQTVIALRLLGMSGALPAARDEPLLMVVEKMAAAQEAGLAIAGAVGRGAGAGTVAMAGLRPVRRRTRANLRRLTGKARK